jgi:uncharacterized protein YggE
MNSAVNLTRLAMLCILASGFLTGVDCRADVTELTPRIQVTGQGSIDLVPDMAVLDLTVTREARTAHEALDANSAAMQKVLEAMQAEGIEARDLQTSGFSIQPKYVYPPAKPSGEREPRQITGYTVRNSLSVRVRDITAVGRILDTSVTLGVNEGGNITFTNDDPSEAIREARIKAVRDASDKAKTLARAAGVKTGRILEISEQSFSPRPMPMASAEMRLARSSDAVPVATGENTYKVTVNIAYAIDQ